MIFENLMCSLQVALMTGCRGWGLSCLGSDAGKASDMVRFSVLVGLFVFF